MHTTADFFHYTETEIERVAGALISGVRAGDWFVLEGDMGAGKTTLARAMLRAAGVAELPEGSPTFPIAHEYFDRARGVRWVHMDLYRLKSEAEIDDAGVPEYFWASDTIVIAEWLSLWKGLEEAVHSRRGSHRLKRLKFSIVDERTRGLAIQG